MDTSAPLSGRPTPALRACDGAPWPTDDELDAEVEWARFVHALDGSPATTDRARLGDPVDGARETVSELDARLGALELIAAERHRLAAEEARLTADLLRDAAVDPTPWVGPDPTLDLAWNDVRGRTVAAFRRDRVDLAQRAAAAEIAVRLRVSEQTVRTRATRAEVLQQRCPTLWRRFADGRTSERHAVEAARLASSLPEDASAWHLFDQGASDAAVRLVPPKFAVAARALRERVHAESLDDRHRRAARDRGVWMTPELDGMATLNALMPADRARGLMSRLDRAARHLHAAPDEERTLAQLRADVLADLVPDTSIERAAAASWAARSSTPDAAAQAADAARDPAQPDSVSSLTSRRRLASPHTGPTVVITVPALTLLGAEDVPATLEGYGPIDLGTARRLAGEASSWVRLLTHPATGAPLALDRQAYRVPAALRRWLGVTSPTCIFPGCNRTARSCDIDHLAAWVDGGTTDADNLEPECRHHHRLRHETGWTPSRDAVTGDLRWVSPLGGDYGVDPPPF